MLTLTITTPLTDEDREALTALLGPVASVAAPAAPPKPAAAVAPKAKAPAPEPEPEPEDLLGTDDEAQTLDSAVARATQLVSDGKAAQVKAALEAAGEKRVSGLTTPAKLQKFFAALEV